MAGAFAQLRTRITEKLSSSPLLASVTKSTTNGKTDETLDTLPCVGFKVTFNTTNNKLTVHVIGARHLPASVGNVPAVGYLVKVKVFPVKDKYETDTKEESWPRYNQSFDFTISPNRPPSTTVKNASSPVECCLVASKFVTLSVLALDKGLRRRSVGSVNFPLELKHFAANKRQVALMETTDMWRRVVELTTPGFGGLTTSLGHKLVPRSKDQLEVTLCHTVREVGEDDIINLRINRLRWGIEKTKEYEHKNAMLYVKMTAVASYGQVVRCQKTLNFAPNISVHWPADDVKYSVLEASVPPVGPRNRGMSCVLTLCTKLKGKKIHLGRVVIRQCPGDQETDSDHWSTAMQKPGNPVTQWHSLLAVDS